MAMYFGQILQRQASHCSRRATENLKEQLNETKLVWKHDRHSPIYFTPIVGLQLSLVSIK